MKNFKNYLGVVAIMALLFTSCSKEEAIKNDPGGETATLSFATVLNNMVANKQALKQVVEEDALPECSDAVPAYVEVILTGPVNVGSEGAPVQINVNATPGDYDGDGEDEYFTEYDTDLELPEGDYQLTHFVVFDAGGNVIWVAPKEGSMYESFVGDALPIDITLEAGTKPYIDVEVLCFDDRVVNLYGYLFFEIETAELQEICFFVNYCDDGGRHYTASYTVDIGLVGGAQIYDDVPNVTGWTDADPSQAYADPLCFAVPVYEGDNPDEPFLNVMVTLQSWGDNYGEVEPVTIAYNLSQNQIEAHFDGENGVDYIHLNFGCEDIPIDVNPGCVDDQDCDCVPDDIDPCPTEKWDGDLCYFGCPTPGDEDCQYELL